ncbi:peptidase [Brevundimonas diminuta]|uniref:M14 family metallopeptidase n=1 Tax=Brevundimonas TaxID=41275 RepID=UPI0019068F9F|nr:MULTISPECIES: M14 metallopeptidase family protein [Brevundimonas]MBK1968179.1 peptidase [Brevundimonas diminuta]MDA0744462.1 M14 family metallopeptidase [Pseudomonadota bacterium]
MSRPPAMLAAGLALLTFSSLAMTTTSVLALEAAVSPHAATATPARALTTPLEAFGHEVGADYRLITYTQFERYLHTLAGQSDRMKLVEIGRSSEGRTQYLSVVSSPQNLANIDRYQEIARRLAKAEGVSEEEARALASEGKAVVWIDGGLHSTETVPPQALIAALYEWLTAEDAEAKRILDDVVILFAPLNPDGWELVSTWYMRNEDPLKREYDSIPVLYQKYVGHDNNRDYYLSAMTETTNVNRQFFREWFPQIIYNHHQTAPAGTVVFMPPFRDPFNYNYDPLVMSTLSEVGAAMHSRLIEEGKPGSTMRSGANYSTWNNGMERSVTYFHNAVGLLTEITGHPTPSRISLIPDNQLPRNDLPMPVAPQTWRFAQSIDYSQSINRAVLNYASRNKDRTLFNIWRMGQNAIDKGNTDTWRVTPSTIEALQTAAGENAQQGRRGVDPALYEQILRDPARRDPRGYVIPADQADLPTAVAFLNSLIKTGVDVERATRAFTVGAKTYPAGSYVVKTAQAYRPHVLDMFEPQDHPHDLQYPGGPPKLPYDATGYTLAMQMGVQFDRILDGFEAPTERVADVMAPPPGRIEGTGRAGWLIDHAPINGFILTNRLLAAGAPVFWQEGETRAGRTTLAPGALWIPADDKTRPIVEAAVRDLGLNAHAVARAPGGDRIALKPIRIGLVDRYGGSMASGWTRWMLEQFEYPFEVVYPQRLDAGDLNKDFDVLVFASDMIPADLSAAAQREQPDPETIPAQYRGWLGAVTAEKTAPQIDAFVRDGGSLVTIGSSHRLAKAIGAPVQDVLTQADGRPLAPTDFFIPGAVLKTEVDNSRPLAFGAPREMNVFFNRNAGFRPAGEGASMVRYPQQVAVNSGWAIGSERLSGAEAVLDIKHGEGRVIVLGPDVVNRAQARASSRLLFNALFYGPAVTGADR